MSNYKKHTIILAVLAFAIAIMLIFTFKMFTTGISDISAENYVVMGEPTSTTYSEVQISELYGDWMLPREDIELIALVTMAEAEGECEEGKRLVIDTILNRLYSEHWPDTVSEVIYQPDQFTSMWNGRVDRCYVSEDICRLVEQELYLQTNTDVVYFTAGAYSDYGEPMFQVGNHYFSSYD